MAVFACRDRSTLTDRRIAATCKLFSPDPIPSSAVQPPPPSPLPSDHHYFQVSAVQHAMDSGSADNLSPALRLALRDKTTQELSDELLRKASIASALGTAGGDGWTEGLPRHHVRASRPRRSGPSTRDGAAQPFACRKAPSR
jgi:hypothetical protein